MKVTHQSRFCLYFCSVCLAVTIVTNSASAQNTATITGIIVDQSGSVVANASVQVVDELTTLTRGAVSESDGSYLVTLLPLGTYRVEVRASGFETYIRRGITLSMGQSAKVDAKLSVGAVTSNVSVTAAAPLVDTRNATETTVMDQQRMVELPLNGRSPASLLSLLPGVSNVSDTGDLPTSRRVWVNIAGGRIEANTCTLDGSQWINIQYSYCNPLPPPDMLEEFSVETNSYDASKGLTSAATISAVTKSGTNQYHGVGWNFLRNNVLNAKDYFSAESPFLVQNQFGFAVGGPIRKNHTFFFVSYQGTRIRQSDLLDTAVPATAAERQGDFSHSPGGIPNDPATGLPFPGGIIPQQDWDPAAVSALSKIVSANTPDGRYVSYQSAAQDANTFMARVDHQLTQNNRLYGRFYTNHGWSDQPAGISIGAGENIPWAYEHDQVNFTNFIINDTHIFSLNLINQISVARSTNLIEWKAYNTLFASGQALGIDIPPPSLLPFPPEIDVTGRFNANVPIQWNCPRCSVQWDIADSLSWIKGAHSLKFGFRYLPTHYGPHQAGFTNGVFSFNGEFTDNAMADFLIGRPSEFDFFVERFNMVSAFQEAFVNDDFRVKRNLTLNLGILYYYETPATSIPGYGSTFVSGFQSTRFPNAPVGMAFYGDPTGLPKAFFYPDRNNVAPRIGMAWDVFGTGKTSVRAGYGIFYQQQQNGNSQYLGYDQPFVPNISITNVNSFSNPLVNFRAGVVPGNPIETYNPSTGQGIFNNPQTMYGIDRNFPNPYVQQYNLSIEQQLAGGFAAEIAYVGNGGRKLQGPIQINPAVYGPGATLENEQERRRFESADPDMGPITLFTNGTDSSYNALEISLNKRFSGSYLVSANYTWSRALDETSGGYTGTTTFQEGDNPRDDWGLADFHRGHVFNLSWVWQPTYLAAQHGVVGQVLHGWEVTGLIEVQSGLPVNVITGRDDSLTGIGNDRPDVVSDPSLSTSRSRNDVLQEYFNTAAFVPNPIGMFGNSGRNTIIGPGYVDADLGLFKNFRITERQSLQFRAEIFNLFNHPNFGPPDPDLASVTFGRILTDISPRIVQFGLKYKF